VKYRRKPSTPETLREEIEISCAAIPVDALARLGSVYKKMMGTLKTCSGSIYVAAVPLCVYQIWIANKLFKQIYCTLKRVSIFEPLCIVAATTIIIYIYKL
jgi:hypothetical protein